MLIKKNSLSWQHANALHIWSFTGLRWRFFIRNEFKRCPLRSCAFSTLQVSKQGTQAFVDNHRVANFPKLAPNEPRARPLSCWFDISGGPRTDAVEEAWPALQQQQRATPAIPASSSPPLPATPDGSSTQPLPSRNRKSKRRRNMNAKQEPATASDPSLEELAKNLSLTTRPAN